MGEVIHDRILALQGSPRPNGFTHMVLKKFLEGAASKGAASEIIPLAIKKIKPCIGCYSCWYKRPGTCIYRDDMPELLQKYRASKMVVFATPLYHYGMTAFTKLFLERTLPLMQPYLIESNGVTTHPHRYPEMESQKMVLISVCGLPEEEHFGALVQNFRLLCRAGGRELVGVLLRPGSESMRFIDRMGKKGEEVLRGFYLAGQELVEKGRIPPETEGIVSQEWTKNRRGFQEQGNLFWNLCMEYGARTRRGEETQSLDEALKKDIRLILGGMALGFRPEAAGDLRATIQFDMSGNQPGQWYYEIKDGNCAFKEGKVDSPTLTIHTPSEIWLAISFKELDGPRAFMQKKYTAEGDIKLLMRWKELFESV